MFRLAGNLISPGGARATLTVLIYHRILAAPDPLLHDETCAATFAAHMELLASEFNVLSLREACARLERRDLPPRAVSVTFDDGYADNERIALPILKRLRLMATFFVATGYSNGSIMFNDAIIELFRNARAGMHDLSAVGLGVRTLSGAATRREAVDAMIARVRYRSGKERDEAVGALADALCATAPGNLMMRPEQIRRLHDEGMEIGAHTVTHPILSLIDEEQARAEITSSKRRLEEIVESDVALFSYPNGKPGRDFGDRDVRLVKEAGYTAAVTTVQGVADGGTDRFKLPRIGPWDRSRTRFGTRLLLNCRRRIAA